MKRTKEMDWSERRVREEGGRGEWGYGARMKVEE